MQFSTNVRHHEKQVSDGRVQLVEANNKTAAERNKLAVRSRLSKLINLGRLCRSLRVLSCTYTEFRNQIFRGRDRGENQGIKGSDG